MRDAITSKKHSKPLGPIHLVALMNIGLFALLSVFSEAFNPLPLYLGVAMAFIAYLIYFCIAKFKMGDHYIYAIVAMLGCLGLVMQYRLSPEVGLRQFIWFIVGSSIFLATIGIYTTIRNRIHNIWLIYGSIIAIFLVTLLFGTELNGAKNWIIIGGFSLQPSEFIKIIFVFFMAEYASQPELLSLKFNNLSLSPKWSLMGLVFILLGFFVLQREFGTALLVFMVYISFLYVLENDVLFPLFNTLISGTGALLAIKIMPHLKVRIDSWLNPFSDISGKGYQITQSLFAIGSGGFFGTGIGLGHPQYIPNVKTDFIFSAICEETGIFGGISVILLFFLLVYRGIKISLRLRDPFTKALAFGLTITLGFQTFIIIGGVTKLIPLTGITLPFISYGGSSLIACYIILGVLQALSGPILRREVQSHEEVNHE